MNQNIVLVVSSLLFISILVLTLHSSSTGVEAFKEKQKKVHIITVPKPVIIKKPIYIPVEKKVPVYKVKPIFVPKPVIVKKYKPVPVIKKVHIIKEVKVPVIKKVPVPYPVKKIKVSLGESLEPID